MCPQLVGEKNPLEHVIFIHEISYCAEELEISSAALLATKYSRLALFCPDRQQLVRKDEDGIKNRKELLLHVEDFGNMGTRYDAEVIWLSDVDHATDLTAGVEHVLTPPLGKLIGLRNAATDRTLIVSFCHSFRA